MKLTRWNMTNARFLELILVAYYQTLPGNADRIKTKFSNQIYEQGPRLKKEQQLQLLELITIEEIKKVNGA